MPVAARRPVGGGVREDLQILGVGDPQVDQEQAAVVVMQSQHLWESQHAAVEGHRLVDVLHLDRHMAEAIDRFHCLAFLRTRNRDDPLLSHEGPGRECRVESALPEGLEQLDHHAELRRGVEIGVHAAPVDEEALLQRREALPGQSGFGCLGVGDAEGDVMDALAVCLEEIAPDARRLVGLDQLDHQLAGLEEGELGGRLRRLAVHRRAGLVEAGGLDDRRDGEAEGLRHISSRSRRRRARRSRPGRASRAGARARSSADLPIRIERS